MAVIEDTLLIITVFAGIHEAVEVFTGVGAAFEEAELDETFVSGLVGKLKYHSLDAFEYAFEHDRADETVAEKEVAAVVVIVDDGAFSLVSIGNKADRGVCVESFCYMNVIDSCGGYD